MDSSFINEEHTFNKRIMDEFGDSSVEFNKIYTALISTILESKILRAAMANLNSFLLDASIIAPVCG
jgi:hypothetical protein